MTTPEPATAWIPDPECRVVDGLKRCSRPNCGRPAVMEISRFSWARNKRYWWAYCASHTYGRRVRDGVVEWEVDVGSPFYDEWLAKQ